VSLAFLPVVAFGMALFLFVLLATGVWINFDAHAHGSDYPAFWGVVAPISGVVFLYYLLWWRRGRSREYPSSRWERSAAVVAVAGGGGLVAGSLVSPPDPVAQMTVWPIAFACCLPVAYWLVRRRFDATEGVRQSSTRE
jgi:quinol-cytochrome oxidoreductase complex cytochrome b subunit